VVDTQAIRRWIDFETLRICVFHTTGSIGSMVCFKAGAMAADHLVAREWLWVVQHIENVTLIGLLLWLVLQLGMLLWNHRVKINVVGPLFAF
jgi:hypothetical protein